MSNEYQISSHIRLRTYSTGVALIEHADEGGHRKIGSVAIPWRDVPGLMRRLSKGLLGASKPARKGDPIQVLLVEYSDDAYKRTTGHSVGVPWDNVPELMGRLSEGLLDELRENHGSFRTRSCQRRLKRESGVLVKGRRS